MSPLLRLALDALEAPVTAPGLRAVACATLLAALDNAIEVPPGSHWACWQYLLGSDCSAGGMHRHEIPHPDVARDAVRVLLDPEAGEVAQDLAMAVLRGVNVAVVSDEDIVNLADKVLTEGRSRRIGWLLTEVHEHRGLSSEFIVLIRDRLAGSDDPSVRASAVDIGALLARLDSEFTTRMLGDGSPQVRAAVAESLERVEAVDRDLALGLVRQALRQEQHRSVLAPLYSTLGDLLRRSRERPEPPEGAH